MKKFELKETRIPNLFYTEVVNQTNQEIPEHVVEWCYDSLFMTMAHYCEIRKSKEEKVALVIRDLKDNFKIGFIVEYIPGENEETDDKGNWAVTLTFDEEDTKDAKKYYGTDQTFTYLLSATVREMHGFKYTQGDTVPKLIEIMADLLINWLDEQARPGEEVVIEIPGYFMASVITEGDKKIKGIVPGENLKNVIKNDSVL